MTEVQVLFETKQQVLFSQLAEQHLGMELKWKVWKPRVFNIGSNGVLEYRKIPTSPIKFKFNLTKVKVTLMEDSRDTNNTDANRIKNENGVIVSCTTLDGFDTYFRCILDDSDLAEFYNAIRTVSKEHNLDNVTKSAVYVAPPRIRKENMSVMRRTLAHAMDVRDKRDKQDRIRGQRGAFKYLPVCFSNDLVHGSMWFTFGSVLFLITSIMIFINSFYERDFLGNDDSFLHRFSYRCTWALMIISGIFCTLGSMAFVRAVHQEPVMKPLFPHWYHFQSDELLGSWLFFFAVLPIIPYSLIYLAQSGNNIVFLGALGIAVCLVFGTLMFVRACYPGDDTKGSSRYILSITRVLCYCCCSQRWLKKHFVNDWLAGTWLIYWGTFIACVVCLIVLIAVSIENNHLSIFTLATGLFENITFLIGSAYFVAGSYPDSDHESSSSSHKEDHGDSTKTGKSQIHEHHSDEESSADTRPLQHDIETGNGTNGGGIGAAAGSIAMTEMTPVSKSAQEPTAIVNATVIASPPVVSPATVIPERQQSPGPIETSEIVPEVKTSN